MNFFNVVLRSVLSIVALFLLTKMMGRKQISQLNLYDYVVGITIGSVAAEISTNLDTDFWGGIVVMSVYSLVSVLLSFLTEKSILMRRFIIGVPIVMMEDGKILESSLKKTKFDINEFLQEARISGYYDISQIEYAIMEANGKISFLSRSEYNAVTPLDMNIDVKKSSLVSNLVIDGKVMENNLKMIGKDINWLLNKLKRQGYDSFDNILLVTCCDKEEITIYEKNYDILEYKVLE